MLSFDTNVRCIPGAAAPSGHTYICHHSTWITSQAIPVSSPSEEPAIQSYFFLGENVASEHKLSHIYKDPSLCMGRVQNGWLVLGIYHIFICPIRKLVLQDNSRRGGGKHPVKELAPGIEKPLPKMRVWIAFSNVQFYHATLGHIQLLMDL